MAMLVLPKVFKRTWEIRSQPFWPKATQEVRERVPNLVGLVVGRLAQPSRAIPAKAVECLAIIFEGDTQGRRVLVWRKHARRILLEAISSMDLSARDRAVALIHRFGAELGNSSCMQG
jgi:hypothetical protein